MSIIQEALKKAQGDTGTQKTPRTDGGAESMNTLHPGEKKSPPTLPPAGADKTNPSGKIDPRAVGILLFILTITVFFAARTFFTGERPTTTTPPAVDKRDMLPPPGAAGVKADTKPSLPSEILPISKIVFQRPDKNKLDGIRQLAAPEFALNGIMYLEGAPRAIINDVVVEVGDTVSGAKVVRIDRQSAVVEYNGAEIVLNLK